MASYNKVLLIGHLTRDPEKRKTPQDQTVTKLGLAVNRKYRTGSGEDREETCFVDVTVWGSQGENCAEYLKKGSLVLVEGRLTFEQWESQQGEKRSRLSVTAERVQFLDKPKSREWTENAPAPEKKTEQPRPAAAEPQPEAGAGGGDGDDVPF